MNEQLASTSTKTPLQPWEVEYLNEQKVRCAKALTRLETAIFKYRELARIPEWDSPISTECYRAKEAAIALHDLRGLTVYDAEDTCEILGKIVTSTYGGYRLDSGRELSACTAHIGLCPSSGPRFDDLDDLLALKEARPLGPYGYNDELREQELRETEQDAFDARIVKKSALDQQLN